MPKEIETKFKIDSTDKLKKELKKVGAKFISRMFEKDIYYSSPFNYPCPRTIRLRQKNTSGIFTVKTPLGGRRSNIYKILYERETVINDVNEFRDILKCLGFKERFKKEKIRETYKWKDSKIFVDKLPYLGSYMEIEAPKKRIKEIALLLNLDMKKATSYTYIELFNRYKRLHKRPNIELLFKKSLPTGPPAGRAGRQGGKNGLGNEKPA